MPGSPCSRGLKGGTHSKLIVWILFSFPEWPRILELLHFVGSVVAGKDTATVLSYVPQKALSLTAQNLGHTSPDPTPGHHVLKPRASTTRAGVAHNVILLHIFFKSFYSLILERQGKVGEKRSMDSLLYSVTHSLAEPCTCPEQGSHLQPWRVGMTAF